MPIKNKDGTTFRLRGPNPVLERQEFWDPDEVILHNFKWRGTVVPAGGHNAPPPAPEPEEPTVAEELFSVEPPPEPVSPAPKPEPLPPMERPSAPIRKSAGKLRVHCLPAFVSEYKDDLYDQSYKTVQYGEKFIADAGIMAQGDIEAVFWSSDDRITVGSILYPMTMEKRWWKVVVVEDRPLGGYVLRCQISEKHPRFD